MSDIDAWKATTQPYSSTNEFYYSTLETAEVTLPDDCMDDVHIDMDYNYYLYSSDRGYIYVDWYNTGGTVTETETLDVLTSTRANVDGRFTVKPKSSRFRLRFVHDMGSWDRNGYWWSLDNLLIRTPTKTTACSQPGTATWVGGDGSWTNTANWCDGRLPRETDDVILACTGLTQVCQRGQGLSSHRSTTVHLQPCTPFKTLRPPLL